MVKDGWYCCPTCGKRIQKLESSSVIYGTPLRCRVCKVDWYPTIFQGAELGDDEPFPMRSEGLQSLQLGHGATSWGHQ